MTRNVRFCVCLVVALAVMATKTWGLDPSEITAMRDFYQSNYEGLNNLPLPWSSEPETACGDDFTGGWSGIACNVARTHITSISFVGQGLKGSIPSTIGGLTYLTRLVLRSCEMSGVVPSELYSITTLTTLDLSSNKLRLCDSTPPATGPSTTCTLISQNQDSCLSGCCGCSADWQSSGCVVDIPDCAPCTGTPPVGSPNGTVCANGRWAIPGPFTGPLIVEGQALIGGDYELPRTSTLIFIGWDSALNVTGKATIRGAVVMYITDAQVKELKLFTSTGTRTTTASLNRKIVTYIKSGVASSLGSSQGRSILFSAHTRRACQRPSTTTSGDTTTYTVSFRHTNACNTWWIILLCMSPTVVAFLIAIPASFL